MFTSCSELLSTSRGPKYRVDENSQDDKEEQRQEDLENNFKYGFNSIYGVIYLTVTELY